MTLLADHLSDDALSALLDTQLADEEARAARAHLEGCANCARRLEELRAVVRLLRELPEVDLPRDFAIGPRLLADPPNVIRLQRWYAWSRAAAASLAAVFVLLVGGTLVLDGASPPATRTAFEAPTAGGAANQAPVLQSKPEPAREAAPAPPAAAPPAPAAARAPVQPTQPVPAAPAAAIAPAAPTPGAAADVTSRSGVALATPDTSDLVKAATSVSALATPTSPSVAQPRVQTDAVREADPVAPLRGAATMAGVLAALAILGVLVVRHRLRSARTHLVHRQES